MVVSRDVVTALQGIGFTTMNRGVQTDSQAVGFGSHFYVLGPDAVRPTQMPGALVEGLFLTNEPDATALRDPRTIDTLAHAYAQAVRDYYRGRKSYRACPTASTPVSLSNADNSPTAPLPSCTPPTPTPHTFPFRPTNTHPRE